MKTILFVFVALTCRAMGQVVPPTSDTVSNQEWQKERAESIALAEKLYPGCDEPGNKLGDFVRKIYPDKTLFPKLSLDSFAPLFYVNVAAQELGIPAQWQALTEAEKTSVFSELSYHSRLVYLTVCVESRKVALLCAQPTNISPATSGFQEDSLYGSEAWNEFHPNQNSAPSSTEQQTPIIAPPAPLTTTEIDPQTGNTTIVTH